MDERSPADTGTRPVADRGTDKAPGPVVGFNPYAEACPTRRILEMVSNKWTSLVVVLLAQGTKRFQELRREIGGISQKSLTQTLRRLERYGLVNRQVYAVVPPKVEYSLTPLGRTLIEPLSAFHAWVVEHVEEIEAAEAAWTTASTRADSTND